MIAADVARLFRLATLDRAGIDATFQVGDRLQVLFDTQLVRPAEPAMKCACVLEDEV